ncbi:hypothetical protein Leryth_020669 [Lithospermum erythrorhizon]|nr:hypothetical protein Leryth_020669 [Lithospermum erythrorhizon]
MNCDRLETFDVGDNDTDLEIPGDLFVNLKNLKHLVLSQNRGNSIRTWTMPETQEIKLEFQQLYRHGKSSSKLLILNNNQIGGTLPKSFGNCTNLIWLSLSNNFLTGEIPEEIGNLGNVTILQLANNFLSGKIPPQIGKCESLLWLDMSHNSLSRNILPELSDQSEFFLGSSD